MDEKNDVSCTASLESWASETYTNSVHEENSSSVLDVSNKRMTTREFYTLYASIIHKAALQHGAIGLSIESALKEVFLKNVNQTL